MCQSKREINRVFGNGLFEVRVVFVKALLAFMNPVMFISFGTLFWVIYFKIKKQSISTTRISRTR